MKQSDFESMVRGLNEARDFIATSGADYRKRVIIGPNGREIAVYRHKDSDA